MPYYFFMLDDDLPPAQEGEQLRNDAAARELCVAVAGELGRNRFGRDQVSVVVLNQKGQLVHRAWTSSDISN